MNNSIYFILLLISFSSCSEPENRNDVSDIYNSLYEQRQFYYNVEYSINACEGQSFPSLYGMVSLNRNSDSGISSGYFGFSQNQLSNYLHSMYLQNSWIHNLSSNIFDFNDADIVSDSLHSPILINPDLLFQIKANSSKITREVINEENVKLVFNLEQKPDQVILVWNEKLNRLLELEYIYNVNSDNAYSRKWSFDYILKSDFNRLAMEYKHQIQRTHQPFL